MAAVRSVNPKAFQVEHGCLSSNEKWGKASTNPALKTSVPSMSLLQFHPRVKAKGERGTLRRDLVFSEKATK